MINISSLSTLTYTCNSVANYRFSLQYNLSLWRCFLLLLEEIQFLSQVSLLKPCTSLLVWDSACLSLEISIQLFFIPFLFSSLCCCSIRHIVSAVIDCFNSSCFALFNVVLKSLNWCIEAIFNVGQSLIPSFIVTNVISRMRRILYRHKIWSPDPFVWVSHLYILRKDLSILFGGMPRCLSLFTPWVFHINFSWCSFTGVWVTASLLKSPGLFSVFWLFSIML